MVEFDIPAEAVIPARITGLKIAFICSRYSFNSGLSSGTSSTAEKWAVPVYEFGAVGVTVLTSFNKSDSLISGGETPWETLSGFL